MKLGDTIKLKVCTISVDEDGDTVESSSWVTLGKCIIKPNSNARGIKGQDGHLFVYSYMLMMKKPKSYPIADGKFKIDANTKVPIEGAFAHITKEDGSIDRDCTISGFVTMKNWLKLWI